MRHVRLAAFKRELGFLIPFSHFVSPFFKIGQHSFMIGPSVNFNVNSEPGLNALSCLSAEHSKDDVKTQLRDSAIILEKFLLVE